MNMKMKKIEKKENPIKKRMQLDEKGWKGT